MFEFCGGLAGGFESVILDFLGGGLHEAGELAGMGGEGAFMGGEFDAHADAVEGVRVDEGRLGPTFPNLAEASANTFFVGEAGAEDGGVALFLAIQDDLGRFGGDAAILFGKG